MDDGLTDHLATASEGNEHIVEIVGNLLVKHENTIRAMLDDHMKSVNWYVDDKMMRSNTEIKFHIMKGMDEMNRKIDMLVKK